MRVMAVGDRDIIDCTAKRASSVRSYVRDFLQWRENWTIREHRFRSDRLSGGSVMITRIE